MIPDGERDASGTVLPQEAQGLSPVHSFLSNDVICTWCTAQPTNHE